MSFFIKNNKSATNTKTKFNTKKSGVKKRKSIKGNYLTIDDKEIKKRKRKYNDDELTSSSDEEFNSNRSSGNSNGNRIIDDDDGEEADAVETVQERKLKLAKIYLEEIDRQERERERDKNEHRDYNEDVISKRLKDDYLRDRGKYRDRLADALIGHDANETRTLRCKEQKNVVTCLCVTDDDSYMFSGSKCGVIVKWSMNDLKKLKVIPFVKRTIDNDRSNRKKANRHNRNNKEVRLVGEVVKGHQSAITSITITTDACYLATGDVTKVINVWKGDDLSHLHTFNGHRSSVTGLTFRRGTHTLYSSSQDRTVKVWSLDEMSYVETLYGHQDSVTSIDALSRERVLTAGGKDGTLRMWKIAEESQLIYNAAATSSSTTSTNEDASNCGGSIDVVRLINEETFVSGGDDGRLCLWNVARKKPVCTIEEAHGKETCGGQSPYWITAIGTLINRDLIATGSNDGKVRLWKLDGVNQKRLIRLDRDIDVDGYVNCLTFTSDGKRLIVAVGQEHRCGRWNVLKTVKNRVVIVPILFKRATTDD